MRGNLSAKDAASIKSEIEGQTTIISLIKEGTLVKPGDLAIICSYAQMDSEAARRWQPRLCFVDRRNRLR